MRKQAESKIANPQSAAPANRAGIAARLRASILQYGLGYLTAPLLGLVAAPLLVFGGIFLGVAWQVAAKPVVDAHRYATFTAAASARIVESWAAIDFDPANLGAGSLYWDRASKISRCAVVEYDVGTWGGPIRRAFCGMRIDFNENMRLSDWSEMLQEGIPFTFLRDRSGFEVQEVRLNRATLNWISNHPPSDTFGMSEPPPTTALAALREQFDWPIDVAVRSWTTPIPDFPLRYDPKHPDEAMPARVVEDSRRWNMGAAIFVLLLAAPGLLGWRFGIKLLVSAEPASVSWFVTLLPLLALPWWGDALPRIVALANRDWAQIANGMLDDMTRSSRLIATEPERAELAHGERLVWHLGQGQYADTFGRIQFMRPEPAPTNKDQVLSALRSQAAAQVAKFDSAQRSVLFTRLRAQYAVRLNRVQAIFTTAAENTLRDANVDAAAHKAARNFLSFASGDIYYDDQLDKMDVAPSDKVGAAAQ